jgi:hypothetical protein
VVPELADRKMAEGLDRREAYKLAAKRMAWPITASTATTLAAFTPLLFWPGVVGEFMKFLPITVLATLTASLAMALILDMVTSRFARFSRLMIFLPYAIPAVIGALILATVLADMLRIAGVRAEVEQEEIYPRVDIVPLRVRSRIRGRIFIQP